MTMIQKIALFLSILSIAYASDICDICKCFAHEEVLAIACKNGKNHVLEIEFDSIEWPQDDDVMIKAFFNNISLHFLPKITGDVNVISINFDNDTIRTISSNPFEYFTNLESISLANNRISELPKDFLKTQFKLKELNLANNSLSSIDENIIAHLNELSELNLSYNYFTKISADFLEAAQNVTELRLEFNKIYAIDNAYDKIEYKMRKLFLAYNQFTVITSSMFEKLTNLEYIGLSDNKISNIDANAFSSLTSLKLLDLSNNNLKSVAMKLPDSLELLTMNNNSLITWPLLNTPENLKELEMRENSLEMIFPKDIEVNNLKQLDVSKNFIHFLPNTQFFDLELLDLSYNLLTSVPQNLNSMAPILQDLVLDGNQIASIEFIEMTTLRTISLSHLPLLHKIDANAFSNLSGSNITFDGSETCLVIKITHNENLVEIDENAFEGVRLCFLDLSYNQLETVPQNLTDWSKIDYGFDLQGNPIACICENEWMLNDIVTTLYDNENLQYFLKELRCHTPSEMENLRLVKFFKHQNPFCRLNGSEKMIIQKSGFGFLPDFTDTSYSSSSDSSDKFSLKPFNSGFIIIVSLCSIILVLMIIVGVKWQRDQNRKFIRKNRLYYYDDYDY